jgi:ParB/RepB/Spo0J family partition protein
MKIEYKKISDLKPYARNPRKNDDAVDYVANSIKEFGFIVPVVIDNKNVIVAGHTRYKAAKKLGIEDIPCIIADDLTEKQINAFRLVDNKTQELSSWDYGKLIEELTGLVDDIDMTQFAFAPIGEDKNDGTEATQDLDEGEELDLDDFSDETFNCTCPCCGFKFND